MLVAPGEGLELIRARARKVHHARYDVVILIRTAGIEPARALREGTEYLELATAVRKFASHTMEVLARNAVRLGDVDHQPDHVFLFNYFYADGKAELLPVFEYTAGWFQAKTGLTNSILLEPLEGESTDNGIINHASWPGFLSFLPSLIFRPRLPPVRAGHLRRQPHCGATNSLPPGLTVTTVDRRRRGKQELHVP